jgi:hypothetical protein
MRLRTWQAVSISPYKVVATYPSDCVPDRTVVLVQVNHHHIPLFQAQVKSVVQ